MGRKYALGLDFGTESARALIVAVDNGEEVATASAPYGDGVIDRALPGSETALEPDWALQNPSDYLTCLEQSVTEAMEGAGISGEDLIGIGTGFTSCTMLPTDEEGEALCTNPEFSNEPHGWVKLWKHHAAQPEADRINAVAEQRGEAFLARYGGKISSEWFFPKALQILNEAPAIYEACDRIMEAGDWLVLQLCGEEKRNACAAGYKALWDGGYPDEDFFRALDPRMAGIVEDKMDAEVCPLGTRAGGLTEAMASRLGLKAGTAVAVAGIDAHVAVPSSTVTGPGKMVMIMGTSLCHMVNGKDRHIIEGMCGVVQDGILPGYYGYEAGQSAVGDLFAWFVDRCVPREIHEEALRQDTDVHGILSAQAANAAPGESGVLCLDWWNGNRTPLVNAELSGLMVGMTLSTTPAEMYRAVLESTAFGTLAIIDCLQEGGCPIDELYACGGLARKAPLLLQIFADVTNRRIKVAASDETVALGSAMWGAVAAGSDEGGYDSITDAARRMAHLDEKVYEPDAAAHEVYRRLYAEYMRLHTWFGSGQASVMKGLRRIKMEALGLE